MRTSSSRLWSVSKPLLALLIPLSLSTCLLTEDLEALQDGQCPPGRKLCSGECVGTTSPLTGCASSQCVPCILANATATCGSNGTCTIAACVGTFEDCNRRAEDGCEIDTDHDPLHCGDCEAAPCVLDNATPDCAAGRCAIRSCRPGFDDCNRRPADGCEAELSSDSAHCSECMMPCAPGAVCTSGVCG